MTCWPFLLARGRRRALAVLLAPDFLVWAYDHDILAAVGRPAAAPGPPETAEVVTSGGRRLGVTFNSHLVTADDTIEPGVAPGELLCLPRDEFGHPLRLIYGVVHGIVQDGDHPAADLRAARTAALRTYRRFLEAEDAFDVVPSQAFSSLTADHQARRARGRARAECAAGWRR